MVTNTMKKFFIFLPLLLFACGSKNQVNPDIGHCEDPGVVEVPCGGFTIPDGAYTADFTVEFETYDADGALVDSDVSEQYRSFGAYRTGCATTVLGVGLHSAEDELVSDSRRVPYPYSVEEDYSYWVAQSIVGTCTQSACYFETEFEIYNGVAYGGKSTARWSITNMVSWGSPPAASTVIEAPPWNNLDHRAFLLDARGRMR